VVFSSAHLLFPIPTQNDDFWTAHFGWYGNSGVVSQLPW